MFSIDKKNIVHDLKLLKILEKDYKKNSDGVYNVGGRWKNLPNQLSKHIEKINLEDFRKSSFLMNFIHDGNVDSQIIDFNNLNFLQKIKYSINKNVLNNQIKKSKEIELYFNNLLGSHYRSSERFQYLIKKYNIENTNIIKTKNYFVYNEKEYTINYLEELNRFDLIYCNTNLKNINTMIEIGGGFGSTIHIHIQNLKKLKKILLIDIFPIIYLSSQYLKIFFGQAVKDYSNFSNGKIAFQDNDELEIICIPPWKINDFDGKIEYFYNSYSFVEMNEETLIHYINFLNKTLRQERIMAMVTYDKQTDKNLSLDKYLNLFNVDFLNRRNSVIWSHHHPKQRDNVYFLYDNFE